LIEEISVEEFIKLPFVARTYWFFRWGVFLIYLFIMGGLAFYYSETIKSLSESSWIVIIGFFLGFVVWLPLAILEMFTSKTVFGDTTIENTSKFLVKKKWFYDDIVQVETSNNGHIRITFANGDSIKVWRGEANLNNVFSILKSKKVESRLTEQQVQENA
jgi:hypothetical protein